MAVHQQRCANRDDLEYGNSKHGLLTRIANHFGCVNSACVNKTCSNHYSISISIS